MLSTLLITIITHVSTSFSQYNTCYADQFIGSECHKESISFTMFFLFLRSDFLVKKNTLTLTSIKNNIQC